MTVTIRLTRKEGVLQAHAVQAGKVGINLLAKRQLSDIEHGMREARARIEGIAHQAVEIQWEDQTGEK
jgi:hypothetical protein